MIVSLQDLDLVMYHYRYLVFLSSVDMAEIIGPSLLMTGYCSEECLNYFMYQQTCNECDTTVCTSYHPVKEVFFYSE